MEETNIEDQIGIVESNKVAYEVIMHDEGVSPLCAIQYFQDWYSSAVRLFYNVLGEDDTTFLHFRSADVTGNRYALTNVYQSLQADYTILLEKVKKSMNRTGNELANSDKNSVHVDKKKLLQDLLQEVNSLAYKENFDDDYIRKKTKLYIKKCFGKSSEYIEELQKIRFVPAIYYRGMPKIEYMESFENGEKRFINLISTMMEDLELEESENETTDNVNSIEKTKTNKSRNVFIVHGHDEAKRTAVEAFVRSIGYNPIVLFKEPNKGQTIIEKIESNAEDICYAIVIYTACDLGKDKAKKKLAPRARQNVVFEHGYMCAHLGRSRVVALLEKGVEQPGDLGGVVYVEWDDAGVWRMKVAQEMHAIGLDIDFRNIKF